MRRSSSTPPVTPRCTRSRWGGRSPRSKAAKRSPRAWARPSAPCGRSPTARYGVPADIGYHGPACGALQDHAKRAENIAEWVVAVRSSTATTHSASVELGLALLGERLHALMAVVRLLEQ